MTPQLEIALFCRGVRVVAGANDAPLLQSHPLGQDQRTRQPIAWWLMPADNLLTVRVEPLPGLHDSPMLDVAVAFYEDQEPPLCRVGWGFPEAVDFAPFELRLPFYPPRSVITGLWREAAVLPELAPEDRTAALAPAQELLDALGRRDVDAVLTLVEARTQEMIAAFEMDAAKYRSNLRRDMEKLMQDPAFALQALDPATVQIRPCCGGRIFHLGREDGGPLVATLPTPTAAPTTMEVYVARMRRGWQIVRF